MRILIVKLSSLGDVVHALPVVADIREAHPGAHLDWVVEPAFAPVLARTTGIAEIIECALRRWRRTWWQRATRAAFGGFVRRLKQQPYDAVIDLQGLTKSALVTRLARGTSYGLANRTHGASHEGPARWLVDHAIAVEPHSHAVDRSRELVARALGYDVQGAPRFGLARAAVVARGAPTVVFVHGTSRDDKLWPDDHWIALGRQVAAEGWRVALPHAGAVEQARADRIAAAVGPAAEVWPELGLGEVIDRMAAVQGVIGVDSGLSHIAVALGLPHVQIYRHPTAWRTGPQGNGASARQVAVERLDAPPSVADVDAAWRRVRGMGT